MCVDWTPRKLRSSNSAQVPALKLHLNLMKLHPEIYSHCQTLVPIEDIVCLLYDKMKSKGASEGLGCGLPCTTFDLNLGDRNLTLLQTCS